VVGQPQSDGESASATSQFTYIGEEGIPLLEFTKTEFDGQALVVDVNASERLGNFSLEVYGESNSNPVGQERVAATGDPTEMSLPLGFNGNSRFRFQVSPAHLRSDQYTETMVIDLAPSVSLDQPGDEKTLEKKHSPSRA